MPVETEIQAPVSICAPRGNSITCKGWQQEAAMRMLMNNLDKRLPSVRRILWLWRNGAGGAELGGYHAIVAR